MLLNLHREERALFSFRLDDDTELRLLENQHAEELFALTDQNREHLRKWLPWLDGNRSIADTRAFITRSLIQYANNGGFPTGIWFKGALAGVIDYNTIDWSNRTARIGYWLGASFQGKGLMTKACRALIDYAFSELKLNRVEIRCATGNKRSRAIPERLGFTQEGTVRQAEWLYDRFVDHAVYGMLASKWQN